MQRSLIKFLQKQNSSQSIVIAPTKGFKTKGVFIDINSEIYLRFNVVIGANGFGKECEGDKRTPIGVFKLLYGFGLHKIRNSGFKWEIVGDCDYWIDDVNSKNYNKHIVSPIKPKESHEKLNISQYEYAIVYDYNLDGRQKTGSALFVHLWKNCNSPTAGCTALSKRILRKIVNSLDNKKNPLLIQGDEKFYKDIEVDLWL